MTGCYRLESSISGKYTESFFNDLRSANNCCLRFRVSEIAKAFEEDMDPGTWTKPSVERRIKKQVEQLERQGKLPSNPPEAISEGYQVVGKRRTHTTFSDSE